MSVVEFQFYRTREVSITQLPIETIKAPVGKSNPSFDLQTNIIFGDNGGAVIILIGYYNSLFRIATHAISFTFNHEQQDHQYNVDAEQQI